MKKAKALLLFPVVVLLAFSLNTMAQDNSSPSYVVNDTMDYFSGAPTTDQRAVFAAFLSRIPGDDQTPSVESAISISNVLCAPPGSLTDTVFGEDVRHARTGTVEFYLWDRDGTLYFYETGPGSPGVGLNPDGTLSPGQTYTVLLSEIIQAITGEDKEFNGYGWAVGNFDGIAGTYNVTIFGIGFTQNFEWLPGMGQGGFLGGIPVTVPDQQP